MERRCSDEARTGVGQHHINRDAVLDEQADELRGLVRSDAAGHAEHDARERLCFRARVVCLPIVHGAYKSPGSLHRASSPLGGAGTWFANRDKSFLPRSEMPRYKSTERAPSGQVVQLELDGRLYAGTYTVDGPMITVDTLLLGSRRAPLGDQPPAIAARLLLLELVYASFKRTGS